MPIQSSVSIAGDVADMAVTDIHDLFTMSDEKVKESISKTHGDPDKSFKVQPLFSVVQNVIKRSNQIVENIVQVYIHIYILYLCMYVRVHVHFIFLLFFSFFFFGSVEI